MGERGADPVVRLALRWRRSRDAAERRCVLAEIEGDAVGSGADPDHLTRRTEGVELLRAVAVHAAGQHLSLPQWHRKRQRLEGHQRLAQRGAAADAVPRGQEAGERLLLDRLNLLAERRERRAPETAQNIGITPLALAPPGSQLAADEQLLVLERGEDVGDVAPEVLAGGRGRERPATLRVAQDKPAQRVGAALEKRIG